MVKIISKSKDKYEWDKLSNKILKVAKKDWKKAARMKYYSEYLKDYIINEESRGKLAKFIDKKFNFDKKTKVLDIGSGLGALTVALARKFDVSGADTSESTLKFVKYRAEQEKVKLKLYKIPALHKGLPFKDKSFDVIVMNGVLEWIACATEGSVEKIHKKCLKEILRVLKKDGLFVFAIENRFAWDWMMGKKSHTQIKYIDLVPRWIADIMCKRKRGIKFKTYIYSKWKYKKMLKEIGFRDIEVYTAYPSYQKPKRISKNYNPFVNSFVFISKK